MLARNTSLLIFSLLLLNSCEDPYQPHDPISPMLRSADSVWLHADFDGRSWSPSDSTDHLLTLSFISETNNFTLLAINRNTLTRKGPGIYIEIDSVTGTGTYAATLTGPARVSFTSTGDGHADKAGKALDGTVVIDVLDTLASPRIHGTFNLRLLQTLPAPDTFTISGEFEGLWK